MTAARRWCLVALGVLVLVSAPFVVRARPVPQPTTAAATLAERVVDSRRQPFTGYVESVGAVALPDNNALSSLTGLLGRTHQVRVWWRDPSTWRVATVRTTGETDLVHRGDGTVRWVYESKRATKTSDVPVRLPTTVDLLPHELARRLLAGARRTELSRLPTRRVAGRVAPGLRLTPADPQSSVRHVDAYVDRETGVPLAVAVFARGSDRAALSSRFVDFSPGAPDAATLRFSPPHDASLRVDRVVDLASAADRFAARVPPSTLAGLARRPPGAGSVGVYGRGPTLLIAVPLWHRTYHRVRDDLEGQPTVRELDQGLLLGAPPMRLLLSTPEANGTSWLLAGTVTRRALLRAAGELVAHRPG
ncbi:MAG: hypothetical protein WB441_18190, partial [Nocardioidaceae bacterium]